MNWEQEKERLSVKYKPGTWRYYVHLWTRVIKSWYHKSPAFSVRIEGARNYVPYIPPGCKIQIFGQDNTVKIDPSVTTFMGLIRMGDPDIPVRGCTVKVGSRSSCGGANIMLYEDNSAVYVGDECMLSFGIEIWASDSHSIIDSKNKQLVNWGKEIVIGNHVWIGMRSILLKNSYIADDCMVGAGSVVAGKFKEPHCILAGNPARVVKKGFSWDSLRPIQYREKFQSKRDE